MNDPPLIHASKPNSAYRNDRQSYKALGDLLTRARIAGDIPFNVIHDPTRPVTKWDVHPSAGAFLSRELDGFLKGYYRDLQHSQPNHLEILGEKNTIASILRPVAAKYCIPMTLGRGYSSIPPRADMAKRFRASGKEGLVLLVVSDLDPEGEDIAHSFARSMRDDFGITEIAARKVALTGEQVERLKLPPDMRAKESSSRAKKFTARHGRHAYELEAVPPEELQRILRDAIDSVLDTDAFNAEMEREKEEAAHFDRLRRRVQSVLSDVVR